MGAEVPQDQLFVVLFPVIGGGIAILLIYVALSFVIQRQREYPGPIVDTDVRKPNPLSWKTTP